MDIYVGNINYQLEEPEIRKLFEVFGEVYSVTLIRDKDGKSKGYAFVQMQDAIIAQRAVDGLNHTRVADRKLVVSVSVKENTNRDSLIGAVSYNDIKSAEGQKQSLSRFRDIPEKEPEIIVDAAKYSKSLTENGHVKISFDRQG